MFVIDSVSPADALALLGVKPHVEKALWKKWLLDGTLMAFIAELDDLPVGLAIAESHPHVLHVVTLEGETVPCRRLLDCLVRRAGERDVSVFCAADRIDLHAILDGQGLTQRCTVKSHGKLLFLYYWSRNQDVL